MFLWFEYSYMYILMIFICMSLLPAEPDTEIVGKYPDNFVPNPGEDEYIYAHIFTTWMPTFSLFSVGT